MARTTTHSTRERLLETAGRIFAANGFRATTIRRICEDAKANVAAVNYHFGGKRKLYEEVLSSIFKYAMGKYPPDLGQSEARTPEERLCAFVRSFLLRLLDPEQPVWHRKVMAREMAEPSGALRRVIETQIHRAYELLRDIIRQLPGPGARRRNVDLCIASVVGQCLFYQRRRHMLPRVARHIEITPRGIDKLARHITEFSLNGLKGTESG